MLRTIAFTGLFLLTSLSAHASYLDVGTVSCSGVGSFDIFDDAVVSCTGDFSIDGNTITSDQSITISADGYLNLDNLLIQAPTVTISALTDLYIGAGVVISGDTIQVSSVDSFSLYGSISALNGTITIDVGSGSSCPGTSAGGGLVISGARVDTSGSCSALQPGAGSGGSISVGNGGIFPAPVPVPAAIWLFGSALLPLVVGITRHSR